MNERNSTQLLPVLVWHDPRVHLLDDTWLLTIFAVLLAIALPWFVSGLHIDFAATAAGLLALAAVHVVLAAISGVRPSSQSRGTLGLSSLHALGVFRRTARSVRDHDVRLRGRSGISRERLRHTRRADVDGACRSGAQ